ncbi:MAG: Nif3-like dinuclear metal center hexameric protein [Chlorobiota bacterium]
MGIALTEFLALVDREFPPETASEGDATGLQLQSGRREVNAILVCYEVTDAVIDEARQGGYDLIVAFHPLLFSPLRALTEADRVGHLSTLLIQYGIALVVLHTRVDAHPEGTTARLAHALGLRVREPLLPDPRYAGYGMGSIVECDPPIEAQELIERVARCSGQPVRYVPGRARAIRTVALVGGSGASFLPQVLQRGLDAFVTGDVKYHAFLQAQHRLWLIDAGHAETERYVPEAMAELLRRCLSDPVPVKIARSWRAPIHWYWQGAPGLTAAAGLNEGPDLLPRAHRCD